MQDVFIHNPNQNNTIRTFSLYQLIPKTCNCPSRFILYLAPNAFLCSHNYLSPFSVLLVLLEPFPCVETNTKTLVPAPHPSNVTSFLNVPYTQSFNIMSPCSFIFPNQLFQSIKLDLTISIYSQSSYPTSWHSLVSGFYQSFFCFWILIKTFRPFRDHS